MSIKHIIIEKTENSHSIAGRNWNAIGAAISAIQSALVLIIIARVYGLEMAGIVTYAYAISNIFVVLGKYGIRNFQVTDVCEKYNYSEYFWHRVMTTIVSAVLLICFAIFYVTIIGNDLDKCIIVIAVSLYRMVDSFEDVIVGRCQQCKRLDIGSMMWAIRLMLTTMLIMAIAMFAFDIAIIYFIALAVSIVVDVMFVFFIANHVNLDLGHFKLETGLIQLSKECSHLCIATVLAVVLGNIPKYIIDIVLDDANQAIFGYLMMPSFCIMLLSNFIYVPHVRRMGECWNEKRVTDFVSIIKKQVVTILVLTAIIVVGGVVIGLKLVGVLYAIDLSSYVLSFALLLFGGGIYAIAYFMNVPITTIRCQRYMTYIYTFSLCFTLLLSSVFIKKYELLGASIAYVVSNLVLVGMLILLFLYGLKKEYQIKV